VGAVYAVGSRLLCAVESDMDMKFTRDHQRHQQRCRLHTLHKAIVQQILAHYPSAPCALCLHKVAAAIAGGFTHPSTCLAPNPEGSVVPGRAGDANLLSRAGPTLLDANSHGCHEDRNFRRPGRRGSAVRAAGPCTGHSWCSRLARDVQARSRGNVLWRRLIEQTIVMLQDTEWELYAEWF
jgi:hypothetical protein